MNTSGTFIMTCLVFLAINAAIALCFRLHEMLENRVQSKLKAAVEKAVRAVEQFCVCLKNSEKKRQAILRAEALLGWYRWFVPTLVIDTAIEAEIYVIKQLHQKLNVDHDAPEELADGEGSD